MITLPRLTKPRQKINLLIAALFIAVQFAALSLATNGTSGNVSAAPNPATECSGLELLVKYETDDNGNFNDTISDDGGQDVVSFSNITTKVEDGKTEIIGFTWTSTVAVDRVVVFSANKSTIQSGNELTTGNYPSNFTGESGYDSNKGVSHVTFCYDKEDTTPRTGTVTVIKDVVGGEDAQDFSFTGGPAANPNAVTFNLDDDNDGTLSNSQFYPNLVAGEYTITETAIDGWKVSVTCTNTDEVVSNNGRTTTFTLAAGANVVCTFLNEKEAVVQPETGSITIVKDANSSDLQEFIFDATGLNGVPTFTLIDKVGAATTEQNTRKYSNLTAKEYTFTEQSKTGWTLAEITCKKTIQTTAITVAVPKVTINLAEGDNVTCTFVNTLNTTPGVVLSGTDEVVVVGGQGGSEEVGAVLGASAEAAVGGVSAGYGAAASTSLSSLAGLGASLSAVGYGIVSLRKRQ